MTAYQWMLIILGGGLCLVGLCYVLRLTYVIFTTKSGIYTQFPFREWLALVILALVIIVFYIAASWLGPPDSGPRESETGPARIASIDDLEHLGWWEVEFSRMVLCVGTVRMQAGSQWSNEASSCMGTPTRHITFEFPQRVEPGDYINEVRVFDGGYIVGSDGRDADLTFSPFRVPGR